MKKILVSIFFLCMAAASFGIEEKLYKAVAMEGIHTELRHLLEKNKEMVTKINEKDQDGRTVLHHAVIKANALHQAGGYDKSWDALTKIRILLQYGADKNIVDNDEKKPEDMASLKAVKSVLLESVKKKKV